MKRLHNLLLVLLMLVLPLQGLAATLAPMSMYKGDDTQSMPCHEQHAAGHATQPSAGITQDGGSVQDSDTVNHMCCHQVLSCTSFDVPNAGARKFSDVSRTVVPLYTLFIPDSPDRPPRG